MVGASLEQHLMNYVTMRRIVPDMKIYVDPTVIPCFIRVDSENVLTCETCLDEQGKLDFSKHVFTYVGISADKKEFKKELILNLD